MADKERLPDQLVGAELELPMSAMRNLIGHNGQDSIRRRAGTILKFS